MMFSAIESGRYPHLAAPVGSLPTGTWLKRSLLQLVGRRPAPAQARDRVREAAEVRDMAMKVQRSDPRFADDLFAAADRHEREAP
jgi:hypothetical protein